MQKIIIIIGVIILLTGIFWPWVSKIPFGRLPGDIIIDKETFKLYIPITSMLIASVLLTVIFWMVRKFF
jgi:hypothetical protein